MQSNKKKIVEALVARHLTLSEFTYELEQHKVAVAQPNRDTPLVFYPDERRFFPVLDKQMRVTGGRFG